MTRVLLAVTADDARPELNEALRGRGLFVIEHPPDRPLVGPELGTFDCIVASPDFMQGAAGDILTLAGSVPVVMVDYHGDARQAVRAMKHGVSDYLVAPFPLEDLMAAIDRGTAAAVNPAGAAPANMIGASAPMTKLFNLIARVSPTEAAVLIHGESGTGKEMVARAIHAGSTRAHQPLFTLNCTTIPAHLVETELFGDAGTKDASRRPDERRGLLEAANRGTLFLDEIGELPAAVQARLLQILQDGELTPLSGTFPRRVDVRLIAATHRDLKQLVSNGQFREDLYYRLNLLPLHIPPLRERGDDIAMLADALLARTARRLTKPCPVFSREAREAMKRYPWPGNVRELGNAIERAVILCSNGEITLDLLAIDTTIALPSKQAPAIQDHTTLEDYFVSFVTAHQDHLTETELAAKLGISRKSLWERRQRLNIPRKKTRKRGPRRNDS